jgi:two-component system sensor histidine kinase BaeS
MLRSLRARLVLTYAGLTLLAVGLLAFYTVRSLESLLLYRLAADLETQASLVADVVAIDLASGRYDAVRDYLERADLATDARAIVVDTRHRVVGVTEVDERGQLGTTSEDPALLTALSGDPAVVVLPRPRSGEVLYVATPIRSAGQVVGALRLAYGLQDVEDTLRTLNLTVAAGALGVVALAAIVALAFARAIANPIRDLTRAAHEMAAGDLGQRLEARSKDEVGELVRSFNTMAEQLREAEVARREFASDVSHELQSLAGAMQAASEALDRGAGQDEALRERLVAGLVGHTHRLGRLTEDLLQLARLEEGRLRIAQAPCSLASVAHRSVAEFLAEANQRGIDLRVQVSDELRLQGDEERLIQAVGNLVENALKYTGPGGRVLVAAKAAAGEYLVKVSDTGRGIPPDELPRIWDRYYRVEGRASGGPGGTGLGLVITARIVKAHGGRIEVESEVGHGSTFTIHLPRQPSTAPSVLQWPS